MHLNANLGMCKQLTTANEAPLKIVPLNIAKIYGKKGILIEVTIIFTDVFQILGYILHLKVTTRIRAKFVKIAPK